MPITQTLLTSGSDETDATSYTTASITPSANRLVLVLVHNRKSAPTTTPTISGNGITWTQVTTVQSPTPSNRTTLFRGLSASPSAGSITIDFAGATQSACHWIVVEFTDVDTTTNQGIVQSGTHSGDDASGSATITLAAFASANNAAFGGIGINRADITNITPGTGFTEVAETTLVNERFEAEFKNSEDATVDWTWNGSGGAERTGIAVEIKALPPSISVAETLVINEIRTITVSFKQVLTDVISFADVISVPGKILSIAVSEIVSLAESFATITKYTFLRTETIVLNEISSFTMAFRQTLTDAISLTESIAFSAIKYTLALSEVLRLNEAASIIGRIWTFIAKSASPTWTFKNKSK